MTCKINTSGGTYPNFHFWSALVHLKRQHRAYIITYLFSKRECIGWNISLGELREHDARSNLRRKSNVRACSVVLHWCKHHAYVDGCRTRECPLVVRPCVVQYFDFFWFQSVLSRLNFVKFYWLTLRVWERLREHALRWGRHQNSESEPQNNLWFDLKIRNFEPRVQQSSHPESEFQLPRFVLTASQTCRACSVTTRSDSMGIFLEVAHVRLFVCGPK